MPRRKRRRVLARPRMQAAWPTAGVGDAVSSLQALHAGLLAQRGQLEVQIQAIENALQVVGKPGAMRRPSAPAAVRRPVGRRGGGRGWRPGSLKAHLAEVLRGGGVMTVKDITNAVVQSGYKTKNKTLAKSVGTALTEMKGVIKVGRGRFRMR